MVAEWMVRSGCRRQVSRCGVQFGSGPGRCRDGVEFGDGSDLGSGGFVCDKSECFAFRFSILFFLSADFLELLVGAVVDQWVGIVRDFSSVFRHC